MHTEGMFFAMRKTHFTNKLLAINSSNKSATVTALSIAVRFNERMSSGWSIGVNFSRPTAVDFTGRPYFTRSTTVSIDVIGAAMMGFIAFSAWAIRGFAVFWDAAAAFPVTYSTVS